MEVNEIIKNNIKTSQVNTTQFSIEIPSHPLLGLNVSDFSLSDNYLSNDFTLTINLHADDIHDIESLLGEQVIFTLYRSNAPEYIIGVISSVELTSNIFGTNTYSFIVNSLLNRLKHIKGQYIYLDKNIKDIVHDVFSRSGLDDKYFEFKLMETYQSCEFLIQHDESDYDFLSRTLSYYGIFYSFEYTKDLSKVIFYDSYDDFPILKSGGSLLYNLETGATKNNETVFSISTSVDLLSGTFYLKDYNYRTPEININSSVSSSNSIESIGELYLYGLNSKDIESNDRLVTVLLESIDWKRHIYFAESDCRGLFPGCRFELQQHPDPKFNIEYLVVSVEHYGDQSSASAMGTSSSRSTYRNKLLLIPQGTHYRSEFIPKPKVNGVITAIVESSGGEYAHLDEQGRYKVKFSYDLTDTVNGESSHPVRLMQSYSGNNHGSHFPLHSGTEVVISCVNGDPDRPILLGTLPNPTTSSPVSSSNNSQNILRSWGGNELLMDDFKTSEKIKLFTKNKNNMLNLDATASANKIELTSQLGEMALSSAKTFTIESGGSQTFQSGNNHIVTIENKQLLMTKNKQIEMTAATDIKLKAGKNILVESDKENIEVTAGKNLTLDIENNMSIEVYNKNIDLKVSNGNINITAAKSITVKGEGGGAINIGQSGSSIEISQSGDLTINGKIVNINASSINITGNSISNN